MFKRKRASAGRSRRRMKRARRTFKRRRVFRKRPGSTVYSYKRMTAGEQIAGNASHLPYVGSLSSGKIQLNNVINVSDFSNLYDQYRINYVVAKFWLKIDPSAQAAATASFPKMYWYRDYDDAAPPSSLNEIRENQKSRVAVMHPNRPVVIKFRPNSLQLLWGNAVTTQYKPAFKQWMDMQATTAQHFGIKYAIDDLTNLNYRVDIETTLYFQCRQAR